MTEPLQPAASESFEPAGVEPMRPDDSVPSPAPVVVAKKTRDTAMWINAALGLALVVAVGGIAFAAGRMTAPATAATNGGGNGLSGRTFQGNGYFPGGFGGDGAASRGFGGASIQGTVTAVTADSITITTASGQTVTLALSGSTTYHQQSSATSADVKTGGTVIIRLGLRGQSGEAPTGPSATDVTIVP